MAEKVFPLPLGPRNALNIAGLGIRSFDTAGVLRVKVDASDR